MEHGAESIALLHKALDLGINYYDTADLYDQGENEVLVGKALRSKRQDLYIATKVGNQLRPDGTGWDWNPSRAYILDAVEHSLKRLQTDYIDVYQLHGGTIDDPMDETIEAFELLKDQGKIRAYGISSIRPNVIREYVARSDIASVMMQYSLLDRRPEESCLELLRANGIGVMVRGAVAKGLLVDKPPKAYLGYTLEEVRQMSNAVKQVSSYGSRDATADRTPAQAALQFVLQNQAVCSVVAGMRTKEQLKENAGALDTSILTGDDVRRLSSMLKPNIYSDHR
jgi:aryl-alcohol dehydrogenase-like predicted oxidoreductase